MLYASGLVDYSMGPEDGRPVWCSERPQDTSYYESAETQQNVWKVLEYKKVVAAHELALIRVYTTMICLHLWLPKSPFLIQLITPSDMAHFKMWQQNGDQLG